MVVFFLLPSAERVNTRSDRNIGFSCPPRPRPRPRLGRIQNVLLCSLAADLEVLKVLLFIVHKRIRTLTRV